MDAFDSMCMLPLVSCLLCGVAQTLSTSSMRCFSLLFRYLISCAVLACVQNGKTALDYAKERGHDDVARLIEVRFRKPTRVDVLRFR